MNSDDIIDWFEKYKALPKQLASETNKSIIDKYDSLLKGFKLKNDEVEAKERIETSEYNVFYIMKYILHKEEQVHSPFLGDLLNIYGRHKQNDLFYNEFLDVLDLNSRKDKFIINNDEKVFFSTEVEKWIGNGEIDIFISFNSPTRRFAIAIENKIYAKDQETQLEGYALYLEREFQENFILLYLTPEERIPETNSISTERFNELKKKGQLMTITYKTHITALLENTLKEMVQNKASMVIKQYLQIIKNNFRHE